MEEPSKPVPNIVLRRCPLGERGHHSLSFLNRSENFSISFPFGVPGLVRFLLLSTQFSVFVRDHLSRWSSWKKISHPWERTPLFKKSQRIRRRVGLQAHARTVRSIKEKPYFSFPKKLLLELDSGLKSGHMIISLMWESLPWLDPLGSPLASALAISRVLNGAGGVLVTIGWSDMREQKGIRRHREIKSQV